MAIETPARIAILGAGPIGLEAALYARFLGYDVDVFERGGVAENVRRWGHVRLFSPFHMNSSPLALAAMEAQDPAYRPPAADALLTGGELIERYLLPLAQTDLLSDSLHTQTDVLAIGRGPLLKGDLVGHEDREDPQFRLLVRDAQGRERVATADVVIDATGTYGNHNWAGVGGIPAIGELQAAACIEYGLPDVLGADRPKYAGRHTLLVGNGYSAATTIVALNQLIQEVPQTRVTWITRQAARSPIAEIPQDRLLERQRIARQANELAAAKSASVDFRPGLLLEEIVPSNDCLTVKLAEVGPDSPQPAASVVENVDRIVANVGYRPDDRLWSELQVHQCYASDGPMKLAAAILGESSLDCLDVKSRGPQSLLNPEPDFYVLGAKSYGRNSRFLISTGLAQIRDLFTIIADREALDLYANMAKLRS